MKLRLGAIVNRWFEGENGLFWGFGGDFGVK
jgi:hypothetical protein